MNEQLETKIVDGKLTITIGISPLCFAVKNGGNIGNIEITDEAIFAEAIREKLEREEEDGTTLLHRAFDEAAEMAIDDGCDGVEVIDA